MNIEVLVSTMELKSQKELINKLNVKSSVIINQTKNIKLENITKGNNRLYSYQERGLSKSRNRAIEHSRADICAISDDDIRYEDNYEEIIEEGYKKYPDADIIAFYIDNVDPNIRRPKRKEGKVNFIKSMQIKSSQITFRRKSIINKHIRFDEKIGTGTQLYSGEENAFLCDCIRNGLKIYYIPKKIATDTIENKNSTWFNGYNPQYFQAKGATFYRMSKILYPLLILQFAFRKYKKYKQEINIYNAIKYMFNGKKIYNNE